MMKVFITGGAGFVGSHIAECFFENENDVKIFDSFENYFIPQIGVKEPSHTSRLPLNFPQGSIVRGNILNKFQLEHEILSFNPQIIIHSASLPLANLSIVNPEEAYESILTSTFNILEIIRRNKLKTRLVFLSSSMVYGDFTKIPVVESHKKNPKELYGNLKLMAENLIITYGKVHKTNYTIIRPSAVYGPGDRNHRVIYKFIKAAYSGETIIVDGDGENKSDFTHVKDVARAIYCSSISKRTEGHALNATTGAALSLNEVISVIRETFPKINVVYREKPNFIPLRGSLDITKIKELSSYSPTYNTKDGIKQYIMHLKDNVY